MAAATPAHAGKQVVVLLCELAGQYRRYGYLRLHVLLCQEGRVLNRKRTYRVYREGNLGVHRRCRKRLPSTRHVPMTPAERMNKRWSADFVSDSLCTGRRFRAWCVVDDYSKESPMSYVDFSISGLRMAILLDELARTRRLPEAIVLDNGPENTSRAMFEWSHKHCIELRFIHPGKPIQNAYAGSFVGKFRDECLNENWFGSLGDARRKIEA